VNRLLDQEFGPEPRKAAPPPPPSLSVNHLSLSLPRSDSASLLSLMVASR
jgi:hypothetical protein